MVFFGQILINDWKALFYPLLTLKETIQFLQQAIVLWKHSTISAKNDHIIWNNLAHLVKIIFMNTSKRIALPQTLFTNTSFSYFHWNCFGDLSKAKLNRLTCWMEDASLLFYTGPFYYCNSCFIFSLDLSSKVIYPFNFRNSHLEVY